MKKLLYLLLQFLPLLVDAQSRYGVEGVPVCWRTPMGVDSSLNRYVLVSTTGKPVQTIVYENAAGQVVNVIGGSLKYGYCDCIDVTLDDGSVTWQKVAEAVKDSIRIGMNQKRDTSITFFGDYNLGAAISNELIARRYNKIELSGDGPGGIVTVTLPDADPSIFNLEVVVVASNDTIRVLALVGDGIYQTFRKVNPNRINEYQCLQIGAGIIWKGSMWDSSEGAKVENSYRIKESIAAKGLSANNNVVNYNFKSIDALTYKFSTLPLGTSSTEYGGWLGQVGDSIHISAPFWVVIGDSQAEGHPGAHGRLHGPVNLNKSDVPGQLSYHLRSLTKMRFYNHGIGGQNTAQILNRFDRDVLAKYHNPGDGIGARTLYHKPQGAVIVAGINDFYTGLSTEQCKANLRSMAQKCAANGIYCVMLNLPGDEIISQLQASQVQEVNDWLKSGALDPYSVIVVDYNKWWRDPNFDDNAHARNDLIIDDMRWSNYAGQ